MNVKIIIVALCAFQLATGSVIDGVTKSIEAQIQNVLSQAQSLIESAQQQYKATISQLTSAALSRLDDLLQTFKANISNRFPGAASRVPACLVSQQENLSALKDDAGKQIQTLIVREASVMLPLIGKVNATIYEGRALLSDTISKLNACRNEGIVGAPLCAGGVVESASQNVIKIAGDMASVAQQIPQAFSNIPIDVQSAISSYINMVRAKLEAIAKEVEQCVRNNPPS